jgi:hypothetical protein
MPRCLSGDGVRPGARVVTDGLAMARERIELDRMMWARAVALAREVGPDGDRWLGHGGEECCELCCRMSSRSKMMEAHCEVVSGPSPEREALRLCAWSSRQRAEEKILLVIQLGANGSMSSFACC